MAGDESAGQAPKRRRTVRSPAAGGPRAPAGPGTGQRPRPARNFYAELLSEAELAEVTAAGEHGLDDEVALLRVLARRAMAGGNHGEVLAAVRALVSVLKVRHGLSAGDASELDRVMAAILEEMGAGPGQPA